MSIAFFMKTSYKIILFLTIFTFGFYLLRTQGQYVYYNIEILTADLDGLTYLYSTVGIIFAILAAFVIISETERWKNLVDATKDEAATLNELWLWSRHLPGNLKIDVENNIRQYLEVLIGEGWYNAGSGQKNIKIDNIINSLHDNILKIYKEAPSLITEIFSTFNDLVKYREKRIDHISFHLPKILKNTLLFSDALLVMLSLLIGVHNPWLNYIFITGVALLGYLIYLLIDDLDNPLRPGGWHITVDAYQELLNKMKV